MSKKVANSCNMILEQQASHIPDNLQECSGLSAQHCSKIQNLNNLRKVSGELNLIGCISLKFLPEGLVVTGDLVIGDCINLVKLPADIRVGGHIIAPRCTSLIEFSDMECKGALDLNNCTSLLHVSNIEVISALNLANCTSLQTISSVRTKHEIYAPDCRALTSVSDVSADRLLLNGCKSLRQLQNITARSLECPMVPITPSDNIDAKKIQFEGLVDMPHIVDNAVKQHVVFDSHDRAVYGQLEITIVRWCCENNVTLIKKNLMVDEIIYTLWVIENDAERSLYKLRWY